MTLTLFSRSRRHFKTIFFYRTKKFYALCVGVGGGGGEGGRGVSNKRYLLTIFILYVA